MNLSRRDLAAVAGVFALQTAASAGRKATVKSLEFPDMTVQVVGNTAIVRHLWVSQTELEGKVTDTKIGVMEVWQKQDGAWRLLARASHRLPQQA
jgi:ketosteroid isomerase-like protein